MRLQFSDSGNAKEKAQMQNFRLCYSFRVFGSLIDTIP